MYGRGNYSNQFSQNQPPVPPPHQQQIPASFQPGTSTAPPSAINPSHPFPSQGRYAFPTLYNLPLAPPAIARHAQTLQAPVIAISRTVTSGQSHVSATHLPGPPPIHLSMPMSSSQFNAQQNPYPAILGGNHNSLHALTSLPPPPLACPSTNFSQNVLPPRLGKTPFWPMVNQQPNNPQGLLTIPSLDPSAATSSRSAILPVPGGTSSSTAAQPPQLTSSLPPPPTIPPQPSSVSGFSSTKLQQQFETEQKRERSLNSATRSSESSDEMLNPSKWRIDAPITGEGHIEEDQKNCKLGNQVKNSSILDSPPKPSDEKLVQNIELLCQYIAKNGPGFEDMIRGRQDGNPDFLFLFGGVPGSEAAIAHNYFQWRKKKYCSTEKLPEGQRQPDLRQSEPSSPLKPEILVLASLSDEELDSDMEMEDDITHFNEDKGISKTAANLSRGTDLRLMKSDVQEELQELQDGLGCVSATGVRTQAFPSTVVSLNQEKGSNSLYPDPEDHKKSMNRVSEVQSDTDSLGSAELPLGGIVLNFPAGQENNVCSSPIEKYDLDNKIDHIIKSGSPFSLIRDYASNDSPETNQKPCSRESLSVNAAGPVNAILSKIEKATEPLAESDNQLTALSNSREHGDVNKQTFAASFTQGRADKGNDQKNDKPESVPTIPSSEKFQHEGSSRSQSDNIHKDEKFVKKIDGKEFDSPVTVKVDEFGRLLKKADSDSDSEDSWCAQRYNKRARYRSPSPSPRSRRSIHRSKREKWSHSPSWSPQRRRSRSRSPFRRSKQFGGFGTRRGRAQAVKCFDFSRGRCHRGASCRYLHQDFEFEGSRHHRRNMRSCEIPSSPARSSPVEKMMSVPEQADNEAQGQSSQLSLKLPGESLNVASEKVGEDPIRDISPDAVLGEEIEDYATVVPDIGLVTKRAESHQIQSVFYPQKMQDETTGHLPAKNPMTDSFRVDTDAAVAVGANQLPQQTNLSTLPKSLDGESTPNQGEFPVSTPLPEASDILQLPRPPLLPLQLRCESGSQELLLRPWTDFATSAASTSSQPASSRSVPTDMLPNHQLPYFVPPLQADWKSISTCQPLPNVQNDSDVKGGTASGSAVTGGYVQNGQRTDLGPQTLFKPYPTEAPPFYASQSQHRAYAAPQKAYHHPDFNAGNSYLTSESVQQFHAGSGHPRELPKSSHPYPYYPSTGFQYAGDSTRQDVSSNVGTSAYRPDAMHGSQASCTPDYGEFRFRNHCNPYASSLEQSHIAQFGSDSEKASEVVGNDVPTDRQVVAGVGPMQTNSLAESARLPLPGCGQYDPLFDISESKPIKRVNDWEPIHVHAVTGIIDSNKPLDNKENNKRKDIGTFIPSLSQEDDGFGETADGEVGVVENASPSQSFAIAETNDFADEVETSQVKSPGKRKKHKEPKSGHLFKNAIANFVKEVLRPSWRQGNMSKEAFKTIVKKTVDKVAGAMKSHRIPKSQEKIDQYIDSSQRKLTKLVMGYVDKYVKA